MAEAKTAAIVLAAGHGTRMNSEVPKALHPLAGRPMVHYLLDALAAVPVDRTVVVVGPDAPELERAVAPHETVVQRERLGTAHAALAAREALAGFAGDVLIVFAGDPLITADTMRALLAQRRAAPHPAVVALAARPAEPGAQGRLIVGADGALERIVEVRDATPEELAEPLCNSGVMAVDGARLFDLLDRIGRDNAKGEYYLTDIVAAARAEGLRCGVVEGDADELMGIDSRADLARAEGVMQRRLRDAAMAAGTTLLDPASVHLSFDTRLGRDVVVEPHVVFGPGVTVGDGARVRAFSHLEGAAVAAGAAVGPFARLRPGAEVGGGARIGNFVEIKAARIEAGAKVNHLAYVGDARVGEGANVGAGAITCNYDGVAKWHTDIGAGAFIGSNAALVAPVRIGDRAVVGAGSVITRDVPDDAVAVTRAPEKVRAGGAGRLRARKQAAKDKAAKPAE